MNYNEELTILLKNSAFVEKYREISKKINTFEYNINVIIKLILMKYAKNDFAFFCKIFYPFSTTNNDYLDFHEGIKIECEVLQLHFERKIDVPIIINTCPGHGKSTIINILYSAFLLLNDPKHEILTFTQSRKTACDNNDCFLNVVNCSFYKIISNFNITTQNKSEFKIKDGGGRSSLTMSTSAIGGNASLVIVDDPNESDKIESANFEHIKNRLDGTILRRTRISRDNALPFILTQQRISLNDATKYILDKYEKAGQKIVHIAIKQHEDEDVIYDIPLKDGTIYKIKRKAGNLWENNDVLKEIERVKINQYVYMAQYQQTPTYSAEELIFDINSFVFCEKIEGTFNLDFIVVDLSRDLTANKLNDKTVFCYFEIIDGKLFLSDMFAKQLPSSVNRVSLIEDFVKKNSQYTVPRVYIEKENNEREIYELNQDNIALYVMSRKEKQLFFGGSKVNRLERGSIIIKANNIYIKNEFKDKILEELYTLTPLIINKVHDDIMDCISDAAMVLYKYQKKHLTIK